MMGKKTLLFLVLFVLNVSATERIIALSPSINEIIFSLGGANQIVGNTEYCTYPEASKHVEKVGGYFSPSLEKIVALHPTLVIMQQNNYKLSQKLQQLDIATKIVKIDTLQNIKHSILEIGTILHQEQKAHELILDIEGTLQSLKNITTNKKVLFVIGHNTSLASRVFVAGQNLYFDDIINASGNTNALQSSRKGQPVLNAENIIATNPDIIILLAHSMKEKHLTRDDLINPWHELPINASRTNSIYIIDKKYAGIPSNRLVYFMNDFKNILQDFAACDGKHIVSQSPYITHTLEFFDLKKCVIGASVYDDLVEKNLPRTGKVIDPDKLALEKLRPDFLFTSDWTKPKMLQEITPKGTYAVTLHGFNSMQEIENNLYTIANTLHLNKEKIESFKNEYKQLSQQIDSKNKRVLLLSACSKEIYSYGQNTYLGDLFSKAGFIIPDNAKNVKHFKLDELNEFIQKEKIDFIFGFVPYSKATTCYVLETQKNLPIVYLDADNFMHPAPTTLLKGLQELKSKESEW
ncbi:helical backbone metal receptor [Sulfurimonas sp. C5]|uniref:helical backbone metal receptor n=1 Tax=Sulfurimonas sp. C5 TaxID=3036947 RepID=UPI002454DC01|nr:helical backbone metal receptor [Sulfurimonas sp. C5]MDH4944793.1 helical backbone metal receptor [Sulfurimonas sp. C5]